MGLPPVLPCPLVSTVVSGSAIIAARAAARPASAAGPSNPEPPRPPPSVT